MNRRDFITVSALASAGLSLGQCAGLRKTTGAKPCTHILTLSFDDGFKKSFYRIAEIHEEYGLKACLNVIASGHFPTFKAIDKWILPELMGNFDDWNALKRRGHEVMPHTWDHLNLTRIPLEEAQANLDKCFNYFEQHLDGYKGAESVYNFAFNASTRELDEYALRRVRAVRTAGEFVLADTMLNPIPLSSAPLRLGCWAKGPECCDAFVEAEVNKFLAGSGGWLILNLHGLDDEGWGPLSTKYLDNLLKRMLKINYLNVLPTGEVLRKTA